MLQHALLFQPSVEVPIRVARILEKKTQKSHRWTFWNALGDSLSRVVSGIQSYQKYPHIARIYGVKSSHWKTHFLGCKNSRDYPTEPHVVGGSQHLHGKHLSFSLCCLDGWMIEKGWRQRPMAKNQLFSVCFGLIIRETMKLVCQKTVSNYLFSIEVGYILV